MHLETLAMLCNPYTHEPLELKIRKNANGEADEFLESVESMQRFTFQNGIPVLYDPALISDYNLYYNDFYRKAARFYDPALSFLAFLSGGGETKFRNQFLDLLEIEKDTKVLEVSVGTGTNISLLPNHASYYGLDLSWDMLARCQKNLLKWDRDLELFYGNAELLPFCDEMFDVVFHVGGINAFNDRGKAITEMIRVAKSGTRIVIVDETSVMMEKLKWMPSVRKMLAEWGERFEIPAGLVPADMQELKSEKIVKGFFYVLSFRKP